MAKRKSKKRTGTHHRRRSHRKHSGALLGAMPDNAMEKIIGITAGAAGAMFAEEAIERRKPMNPMIVGGAEIALGAILSGKPGLVGYAGDGIIAAGALNFASALRGRMHDSRMNGPEYVVTGADYITENEPIFVDGEGYLMTGAGEYITGPDGQYITEDGYYHMMGDVNQGGLGDVNQGGLGDY